MNTLTRSLLCTLLTTVAAAQMEKRAEDLYDVVAFRSAAPAIGTKAPELVLTDLDGVLRDLRDYRGRTVVLIKAGFT